MDNDHRVLVQGNWVNHSMKVIMLNAPPGAGKDTVADFIEVQFRHMQVDYKRRALADMPKAKLAYRYGVSPEEMFSRDNKDKPWPGGGGKTSRDLVIEFSERQKEVMGQNLWARLVDEEVGKLRQPDILIITDLGFDAEFDYFVEHYPYTLLKIKREGCTYSIDSRKDIQGYPGNTFTIINDGDLEDLRVSTQFLCRQLLQL